MLHSAEPVDLLLLAATRLGGLLLLSRRRNFLPQGTVQILHRPQVCGQRCKQRRRRWWCIVVLATAFLLHRRLVGGASRSRRPVTATHTRCHGVGRCCGGGAAQQTETFQFPLVALNALQSLHLVVGASASRDGRIAKGRGGAVVAVSLLLQEPEALIVVAVAIAVVFNFKVAVIVLVLV